MLRGLVAGWSCAVRVVFLTRRCTKIPHGRTPNLVLARARTLRALAAASRVVELRRAHGLCSATSAPVTASRTGETRTGRHERAGELCFGHRERLVIQNPASRCPPSAVPRGNGQAGPGSSSSPPRLLADLGTVRVLLMLFLFLIVSAVDDGGFLQARSGAATMASSHGGQYPCAVPPALPLVKH